MKRKRRNRVLGLSIGERSLWAAEVVAADRPRVVRLAELVYPEGVDPAQPRALGPALARFLQDHRFGARAAVVGLPTRWLVVKPKEVPPADPATATEVLRLSAEAEFSSELKDLAYDFAGRVGGVATSVLLMATPRKYVAAAVELCEAAKLAPVQVTVSALALGQATRRSVAPEAVVLAVAPGSGEMTAQQGSAPNLLRHLRGPEPKPPFVSELRRAMLTLPPAPAGRDLVLWNAAGLDPDALGADLGVRVRSGDLAGLGVDTSDTSVNGEGPKYAAAIALALGGLGVGEPTVDFLHSRLAPPRERRIPRWALAATLAVIAVVAGGVWAYSDLQNRRADLGRLQAQLVSLKPSIRTADAFVTNVSLAQGWYQTDPRYLACLRDLTDAVPDDGQTYATSIVLREPTHQSGGSSTGSNAKTPDTRAVAGQFFGKTSDQQRVQVLLDRINRIPNLTDVKLGGTQDAGRGRDVAFSITFTYVPPKKH